MKNSSLRFTKSFRQLIARLSIPGYVLWAGFAAMLLLMVFLTAVGVRQLDQSQARLDRIMRDHMAKIVLANRMHVAARERTIILQRLVFVYDPFERDELWMSFLGQGTEFATARQTLLSMPLSARERELLDEQGRQTGVAVPLQDQVLGLIWQNNLPRAQQLLATSAIPAQDRVLAQLKQLYQLQEQQATEASAQMGEEHGQARLWLLMLAIMVLLFALAIAHTMLQTIRRAAAALRAEKERAQVTLDSLGEAVIRTDADGRIEYLNPVALRLTGWPEAEALGQNITNVFRVAHDSTRAPADNPVVRCIAAQHSIRDTEDLVLQPRSGEERAIELTASPLRDAEHQTTGAVLVFRDVTEMRALAREITYQATHDPMTGLLNRREFERLLQLALEEARRANDAHALCYLDLDLFKAVNDTCGHLAGDELLRQISLILRKAVRKEDVLARIGGDEFVVFLRGCDLEKAGLIAEQIRRSLREFRFVWEDKHMEVGASIGVVRVAADSGDLNDVLRAADVACRVAKEAGRNRIHLFRPNDLTVTRRQHEINWVQRIGQAIQDDQFVLYGQWIRPLGSDRPSHCEVLIRLRDEQGQIVAPAAFLPAAERYHLMPQVDRWVLHNTLQLLRALPDALPNVCFHVNLSGQTLCDSEFLAFATKALEESGVPPTRVGFEITETAAVTNMSSALRLMSTLKELGCRFALDDFGSGVSSFSYLKNMPVDALKIDGAFVSNLPDDRIDLAMVNSVNQVAHAMGITTIAEYVENELIRDTLESLGVDYGQGFALARPVPLTEILREPVTARRRGNG
jgi:diguanylate cyclase (GGDEF)-like protein/PAS domain S-box-containing protein